MVEKLVRLKKETIRNGSVRVDVSSPGMFRCPVISSRGQKEVACIEVGRFNRSVSIRFDKRINNYKGKGHEAICRNIMDAAIAFMRHNDLHLDSISHFRSPFSLSVSGLPQCVEGTYQIVRAANDGKDRLATKEEKNRFLEDGGDIASVCLDRMPLSVNDKGLDEMVIPEGGILDMNLYLHLESNDGLRNISVRGSVPEFKNIVIGSVPEDTDVIVVPDRILFEPECRRLCIHVRNDGVSLDYSGMSASVDMLGIDIGDMTDTENAMALLHQEIADDWLTGTQWPGIRTMEKDRDVIVSKLDMRLSSILKSVDTVPEDVCNLVSTSTHVMALHDMLVRGKTVLSCKAGQKKVSVNRLMERGSYPVSELKEKLAHIISGLKKHERNRKRSLENENRSAPPAPENGI